MRAKSASKIHNISILGHEPRHMPYSRRIYVRSEIEELDDKTFSFFANNARAAYTKRQISDISHSDK